jgi:LuxR family maltose regulon positive regulatory protein
LFELRRDNLIDALKWESKLAENIDSLTYDLNYIPVRLLIAQRKRLEATDKLQVLYDSAVQSGMRGLMILYRLHQTLAAENEESALNFLADALTMAEPEGYIRTFVDEGKLLKPLLQKALSKGVTPEYTRKLLTIIEAEERQKRKMKKVEGAPSPYRALLSERELEVLQLMAEGLSNQQIADRLIISLSTAKNHVHNILEKLNVQGRTQAVAQARELEFI